ncbi:MAG: zinc-dependent metalloprotease [Planctomycetaceae bacterium]
MRLLLTILVLLTGVCSADETPKDKKSAKLPVTIAEKIEGMTRADGFFPFYIDQQNGTLLAEIGKDPEPFIYASGLSSGLGSNPVGLDRGQWGSTRLCVFKRVGKRVFLIQQNTRFRATSDNSAERTAVNDSFADSIFWATDVVAETDGSVLIDVKSLLVRDAHQVVSSLKGSGQGDYKFSKDLSFVELDRCKAFPLNSELNAMVTFTASKPGSLVRSTAADGRTFSLRLHHSFVQLPEPGYKPRKADPRVASFGITYADYSAPLDKPLEKRFIARHRLAKRDPASAKSLPVEPIIYYLDPGTPEPIRSALLEGARWWNQAFEAAGYIDAFVVKVLPEDVDPMDVRYNVIQWVHRRTRGWSYGQTITDPRTGEIIKGHVLLGSLRVRQDRLIVDGITSNEPRQVPIANACGVAGQGAGVDRALAVFDAALEPIDVSLARLRQLSAHEVGHTIGFSHNFAASTYADRASVMDYPAPRVKIGGDGELDMSDAYGVGIGEWDKFMVRYAYSDFGIGSEERGLEKLLDEATEKKLLYLSDADARPSGAANPLSNLWDNGTDPIDELDHLMKVRRIALNRLDEDDLLAGQNLSDLETVLVPVYLYHRYQVDAVAKMIGGFDYDYAVVGETRKPVTGLPKDKQQAALEALLTTLDPNELAIPSRLLKKLAPRPNASAMDRERFEKRTAMIFDPDAAVRTAARATLRQILQPERLARLAAYGDRDWNPRVVLLKVTTHVTRRADRDPHVHDIVEYTLVRELIDLAGDESTSHAVRAAATNSLVELTGQFQQASRTASRDQIQHYLRLIYEIDRFRDRPHAEADSVQPQTAPPGSPIGSGR